MNRNKVSRIVTLTTLLMASNAQAELIGNFLLGVEGGYAWRDAELNTYINSGPPLFVPTDMARNHHDNGGIWGILGGYQVRCNNYLFGLEADLSWQDFGDTRNFVYTDNLGAPHIAGAKFERDSVYAVTARFGYQVLPWVMPYVKAGVEGSDDTIYYTATVPGVRSVAFENSRHNVRFQGGVGLEFPLVLQSVVRVEYNYSSRNKGAAGNALATDGVTYYEADIKPNQHTAKLAVVWNFQ